MNKIQKIFGSEDFNEMSIKELENKYKNEVNFQELITLKSIYNDILTGAFKLTKDMLDHRGNRLWQLEENKTRGNKPYYPPMGWIGIGLNVNQKSFDGEYRKDPTSLFIETGKEISIPAKTVPVFAAGKKVKTTVNGK